MKSAPIRNPKSEIRNPAIVLAGGRSTRFGSDKASALLAGKPLLEWAIDAVAEVCSEVIVVAAQGQVLPEFTSSVPVRVVHDRYESLGPLAGLVTGFEALTSTTSAQLGTLVVSCDAPLLAPELLRALLAALGTHAAAVPEVGGRLQPLVAAYRHSACLPHFRARLERGELGLARAITDLDVLVVPESEVRQHDPELHSIHNINTPHDLAQAESQLRTED